MLKRIAVDVTPIRVSRDFRLLSIGGVISSLGTQAVLVALPIQIYTLSHSAVLVGLLGLFELGPMIVVSLVGGAIADRRDRRPVLAAAQVGVIIVAALLFTLSLAVHRPPVLGVLLLGGLLAGCTALDGVARGSILPGILGPEHLRSGMAFSYGMFQATGIVGPGVGGLVIALVGVRWMYLADALSCFGMLMAALAIAPQPPHTSEGHPSVAQAITEGLRFVVSNKALAGSFVIDINAMLFGMPRALFVLSDRVYHAGAGGTGLLYSAIAVGGTVSVLASGWIQHVNRLGRTTIGMVVLWGTGHRCGRTGQNGPTGRDLPGRRRVGRRHQRGLPLDHQSDGHPGPSPRSHELRVQPGRDQRSAPGSIESGLVAADSLVLLDLC